GTELARPARDTARRDAETPSTHREKLYHRDCIEAFCTVATVSKRDVALLRVRRGRPPRGRRYAARRTRSSLCVSVSFFVSVLLPLISVRSLRLCASVRALIELSRGRLVERPRVECPRPLLGRVGRQRRETLSRHPDLAQRRRETGGSREVLQVMRKV